jgi:hypothetical protein
LQGKQALELPSCYGCDTTPRVSAVSLARAPP